MNFEEKMKMRNGHLMDSHAAHNESAAQWMSLGLAAFAVYMEQAHQKAIVVEDYCKNALFVAAVNNWKLKIQQQGMKNILAA